MLSVPENVICTNVKIMLSDIQLECDQQWHVQNLTERLWLVSSCCGLSSVYILWWDCIIMFLHLLIFFSFMNWSIHSYSGGKLTIRVIHVHIVLQYHSQSNMQKLVRNSVSCHPCRCFLHFSSFYLPSPFLHFSFPPMFRLLLCPA